MGSYKYLVAYFSLFAMFFSILDVIVKPYLHSHRYCFVILSNIANISVGPNFGQFLLCSLCGCYGTTIAFFAVHFIYRYFALERQGKLRYFQGIYILIWVLAPILTGAFWGYFVHLTLGPNDITSQYVSQNLLESFNFSMRNITYVSALYFLPNPEKASLEQFIHYKHFLGMIILMIIVAISLTIVLYYGIKSYGIVKNLVEEEGESEYTRSLQKQLYKALVVQAILPIFTMYVPVEMYLLLPIIGLEVQWLGQFVTFIYALYPALDPLPLLFIIDNYRNGILNIIPRLNSSRRRINPGIEDSRNTNLAKI